MPKLLVIDDEPSIHFSIEQVFAKDVIQVFGAESAADGLRLAEEESPDVILLDIRLGDRSGLEVFHDLRRIDPRSLIVFITGYGTHRHRDRGHETGGLRLPGQAAATPVNFNRWSIRRWPSAD